MSNIAKMLHGQQIVYTFSEDQDEPWIEFTAFLPLTPSGNHSSSQVNKALAAAFRAWLDRNFPEDIQ